MESHPRSVGRKCIARLGILATPGLARRCAAVGVATGVAVGLGRGVEIGAGVGVRLALYDSSSLRYVHTMVTDLT